MKKRHCIRTAAAAVGVIGIGIAAAAFIFSIINEKEENGIYHDEIAQYGALTVGITKSASVSAAAAGQTFDLDIGALTGGNCTALQIEEVLVSAGQQVQKGTALFRVTADSVQNARTILQRNVLDANRDCELLEARQRELRLQASQGYDNDVMDGKYAGMLYNNRREALQKKADDAKKTVDDKQNQVNENLSELTQAQQELVKARKYLNEAEIAVSENYDDRYKNAYYYTVYEETREAAENMVNHLEEQVERLTQKNESLLYEVDAAVRVYHQILQDLEKEKLTAKMDYDTEILGSETATEWYDIQMIRFDNALQEANARYQSVLQNIRQFNAYLLHNQVHCSHSGVIADIMVEAGDTVGKDDRLVLVYGQETVTLNVSLSETDYLAVNQEETVNVSLMDYPDRIFEGRITDVSNRKCGKDSENPYYIVTVAIQGDVSGICEGMSGNVTFLTSEVKEVLYVPDKAVFREGERAYVKMRNKRGNIEEKDVTTGFSDGIYTEIIKGISEGDAVLSFSGSL